MFFCFSVIHYFAHCFNVDYFTTSFSNGSDPLIQKLNEIGEKPEEQYLNPIRSPVVSFLF